MFTIWFIPGRLAGIQAASKTFSASLQTSLVHLKPKLEPSMELTLADLSDRVDQLVSVLNLASSNSAEVTLILTAFSTYSRPMTGSSIQSIGQVLVELVRMEETLVAQADTVNSLLERGIQHTQFLLINLITAARKTIVSDKKYSDTRLDNLSLLILAERCLSGPGNGRREAFARLTLGLSASGRSIFKDSEWRTVTKLLDKLEKLINYWDSFNGAIYIPALFWETGILGVILEDVHNTRQTERIQPLFKMWSRASRVWSVEGRVRKKDWEEQAATQVEELQDKLEKLLEDRIIDKVCSEVETQLRLTVHDQAGIKVDTRNPFKCPPVELQTYLDLEPIQLLDKQISIKHRVEEYLSKVFYNLTTVSLYNWRTYSEMRQLAEARLGLHTVEDQLPPQTLEQGLDILQVIQSLTIIRFSSLKTCS